MKAKPSDAWVARTNDGFRPKLAGLIAQLHLKAGEEDEAFPLIEQVAKAQPDEAKSLVREFLTVWTRNHNPNENRNRYRYSWFFYGFENRAESIPLTRSKQERNLEELSQWAARIRKLPIPELDEDIWVRAFTACHSSAEVYKTEAIEKVFGPLGGLKPKTLAGLAQQMRTNLTGLWRDPNEQQQKKTNRKKKDLEAEVMELIWSRPPDQGTTVRDVFEVLYERRLNASAAEKKRIAYTTIMNTMTRLAKKNLLRTEKQDQAYIYYPNFSQEEFVSRFVEHMLENLLVNFAGATLNGLSTIADPQVAAKARQLLDKIARRRATEEGT
jgi:predicted transcriptional regulator